MISVQIAEDINLPEGAASEYVRLLENAALTTLHHVEESPDDDLSVVLTDDAQLHELNKQYLGHDSTTDVLSFPSGESDPDSGRLYLGDVLISFSRALAQAKGGGHEVEAELQLLCVHGVLHLLGYDHLDEAEKNRMWTEQDKILTHLGLQLNTHSISTPNLFNG
jgi:probable rRNA maturation factor